MKKIKLVFLAFLSGHLFSAENPGTQTLLADCECIFQAHNKTNRSLILVQRSVPDQIFEDLSPGIGTYFTESFPIKFVFKAGAKLYPFYKDVFVFEEENGDGQISISLGVSILGTSVSFSVNTKDIHFPIHFGFDYDTSISYLDGFINQ